MRRLSVAWPSEAVRLLSVAWPSEAVRRLSVAWPSEAVRLLLASVGFMPNGVELVKAEVRKHSGEGWVVLDIAILFTGRLAPFRF